MKKGRNSVNFLIIYRLFLLDKLTIFCEYYENIKKILDK